MIPNVETEGKKKSDGAYLPCPVGMGIAGIGEKVVRLGGPLDQTGSVVERLSITRRRRIQNMNLFRFLLNQ